MLLNASIIHIGITNSICILFNTVYSIFPMIVSSMLVGIVYYFSEILKSGQYSKFSVNRTVVIILFVCSCNIMQYKQ